jgi:plastocyanin
MKSSVKALTVVLCSALSVSVAVADDAAEMEEMRREMRDMRAQVKALQQAAAEAADLARRSVDIWTTALAAEPESVASSAPALDPATTKPRNRTAPPALAREPRTRKESAPEAARTGVLQGKVQLPAGEPVAYVYVENVAGMPVHESVTIDQKNKRFVPAWAVVRSGTTIKFPNSDNIYHNVFSLSSGNTFDLGLYNSSSAPKTHTFNAPGAVDVYCNIHPQMAASVLVVPNQLFAKVKPDGTFAIKNVPQGQRKVVVWSPGSKLASRWVEIGDGAAQVELKLEPRSGAHPNKQGRAYGSYE